MVGYCAPNAGVGVVFCDQVMQSVIILLIWRWSPCDDDFTMNHLLQFHWARRFGFICGHIEKK